MNTLIKQKALIYDDAVLYITASYNFAGDSLKQGGVGSIKISRQFYVCIDLNTLLAIKESISEN